MKLLKVVAVYGIMLGQLIIWPIGVLGANTPLTVADAWKRVRSVNPLLKQAHLAIDAAQGQLLQAGLLPNPSIYLAAENIGGSKIFHGVNAAESTLLINQPIEWPSTHKARQDVAKAEVGVAKKDYLARRASLYSLVTERFIMVVEAQSKLRLAKRSVAISQQTVTTIKKRIKAGRASELELRSANIALIDSQNQVIAASLNLQNAREGLSTLWAGHNNNDFVATLKKINFSHYPRWPVLLEQIKRNPQYVVADKQAGVQRAQVTLAHKNVFPYISIGGGIRHFNFTHNHAWVVEVSMPLPIFDRNQGNISLANAEYQQSLDEIDNLKLITQNKLFAAYQTANKTLLQVRLHKQKVLPQAHQALQLARQGYQQGRFSYLDLLSAQKQLVNEEMRHVELLATYHKAWFQIMILTGKLPK